MKNKVKKQKIEEVETIIPSVCLISSEDIADAIGLSHGEVCDDIEVMANENLRRSGTIIEVTKEDLGGVGMYLVFLLDLEAVMEWTSNMPDKVMVFRQAILTRFLELTSVGTKHYEKLRRKDLSTVARKHQLLQRTENRLIRFRDTEKELKMAIVKNNQGLLFDNNLPRIHVGWKYQPQPQ